MSGPTPAALSPVDRLPVPQRARLEPQRPTFPDAFRQVETPWQEPRESTGPGGRTEAERSLHTLLLDAIVPAEAATALDGGGAQQALQEVADRLERAAAEGDRLTGWVALIVRHEANKQDLLRSYLDGTG